MNAHAQQYLQVVEAREMERARADVLVKLGDLQARRAIARQARDFALADALRAEIEAVGIRVADDRLE